MGVGDIRGWDDGTDVGIDDSMELSESFYSTASSSSSSSASSSGGSASSFNLDDSEASMRHSKGHGYYPHHSSAHVSKMTVATVGNNKARSNLLCLSSWNKGAVMVLGTEEGKIFLAS